VALVEPTLPRRRFPRALLPLALFPAIAALADTPIASSSFVGFEDPLFENGAWAPLTSMSPDGVRFQKNNGAMVDVFNGAHNNHAGARTTAAVPTDHYSEIVVGHVGNRFSYVGPFVRVQQSGPAVDSGYLWWGSLTGGDNNNLYRIDANGTSYGPTVLEPHSPITDGDRLRLIARGPVIYGIKNGVREFIHNTGQDRDFNNNIDRLDTGTAGILAYVPGPTLTDATIASWSAGAAPTSSGVWASSNFAGVEDPLDEGDRWYPLPTYHGFKKAGGFAVGKDGGHNFSGVWSISPPPTQYSQVTLGAVGSGGGGPVVRIDRTNPGPTGWLLFLWVASPSQSGIYKVNPDGSFNLVRPFTPSAIVTGDKWRLTATGNVLEVFQNGVSQFTFTTDGSYPAGDVGMEALTPAFTFMGWEGGDPAGATQPPTISGFTPASGPVGTSVTISGTNFTGATSVTFNGTTASFSLTSATAIQATVPAGATSGPISVTTPGGTATSSGAFTVVPGPAISGFSPASGTAGTSVTISGTSFSGATAVAFNGVSATFTVSSDTAIQTSVPAGATSGALSVTTPGGTATSSGAFTVLKAPAIFSFTPTTGPVGTSVTINGTSFSGATAVAFNGVSATFTVSSDTVIQTSVPAGATSGPLSVTTPGGTASSANAFTVPSPPTITGLAPASGPVGTAVTISGTNLAGATAVAFNGVSASFTVSSATAIQTAVPAGATTGQVSVTAAGGTAQSPAAFTVIAPPTIASFTPASGPVGTSVTISGSGLTGASSVTFNGVGATFTVQSDAAIQAIVPSGAGTGPVSVTTAAGTATSAISFTVTVPTVPLTVVTAGNGQGSVTSTSDRPPVGTSYQVGTVVTLTAAPATGSNFTSWTGCDSVSGATCTVTMNAARSVTATFTLQTFPLRVTKSNLLLGNGTVTSTSSPGSANQINCGSNCTVQFNYGTVVTLTASPALLSSFNGWTGCDSVSGNVCTVTIQSARSVNAAFLP
jgi:Divergent InlB B-repeat domain